VAVPLFPLHEVGVAVAVAATGVAGWEILIVAVAVPLVASVTVTV